MVNDETYYHVQFILHTAMVSLNSCLLVTYFRINLASYLFNAIRMSPCLGDFTEAITKNLK